MTTLAEFNNMGRHEKIAVIDGIRDRPDDRRLLGELRTQYATVLERADDLERQILEINRRGWAGRQQPDDADRLKALLTQRESIEQNEDLVVARAFDRKALAMEGMDRRIREHEAAQAAQAAARAEQEARALAAFIQRNTHVGTEVVGDPVNGRIAPPLQPPPGYLGSAAAATTVNNTTPQLTDNVQILRAEYEKHVSFPASVDEIFGPRNSPKELGEVVSALRELASMYPGRAATRTLEYFNIPLEDPNQHVNNRREGPDNSM